MPRVVATIKEKTKRSAKTENKWEEAIRETEARVSGLERERQRLKMAIRLMRRQIREGAPWPGLDHVVGD